MTNRATAFGGPSDPENWDDVGLLAAFNRDFGTSETKFENLQKILGTPPVKDWYNEYKGARAAALALPALWKQIGLTPEHWNMHLSATAKRKNARASHSNTVTELAAKYQKQLRNAELSLEAELAATSNPVTKIVEMGYNSLGVLDLLAVEGESDADTRSKMLDAKLNALRRAEAAKLH